MIRPILLDILAPILLLVALGALMRRKFQVDIPTLTKLNIYLFVPAFIFHVVSRGKLSWAEMGGVMLVTAVNVMVLGLVVWGIGRAVGARRGTLAAVALAVMFYNSGNYGLPLAQLAYPAENANDPHNGAAVQAFVMMAVNLLTFTIGMGIAAAAHHGGIGKGVAALFRLPILPGLACGILAQWWVKGGHTLPVAISKTSRYIADGLVPIALVTLGAQLASNPRWPRWKPVGLVLFLRLIVGPVQMMGLLYLLHGTGWRPVDLWPWPAELLILTASVPTAVNTLLLTLEIGGDAELAADCVFWTTVCSCVTITGWLIVLRTVSWFH